MFISTVQNVFQKQTAQDQPANSRFENISSKISLAIGPLLGLIGYWRMVATAPSKEEWPCSTFCTLRKGDSFFTSFDKEKCDGLSKATSADLDSYGKVIHTFQREASEPIDPFTCLSESSNLCRIEMDSRIVPVVNKCQTGFQENLNIGGARAIYSTFARDDDYHIECQAYQITPKPTPLTYQEITSCLQPPVDTMALGLMTLATIITTVGIGTLLYQRYSKAQPQSSISGLKPNIPQQADPALSSKLEHSQTEKTMSVQFAEGALEKIGNPAKETVCSCF